MDYHFTKEDAIKYGVEAAIILYNLKFWIIKNKANNKNFMEGHYWTYNSCNAFMQMFPFWSKDKIWRILRELEKAGIIKSKNFNTNKMNQSKWYCFIDENFINDIEADPEKTELVEMQDASCKNETCNLQNQNLHFAKMKNAFRKNEKSVYNMITDNKLTDNKQKIESPEQKAVPDTPKQAELLPDPQTEKPKTPAKPKQKAPKTPQAEVFEYFAEKYKNHTGIKYLSKKEEFVLLAKLIAEYNITQVKQKIDWLEIGCTHPGVYWFAKDINDFNIKTLQTQWNLILPKLTDKQRKQQEKQKEEAEKKAKVMAELAKQGVKMEDNTGNIITTQN